MKRICFDNTNILEINGFSRKNFGGQFASEELTKVLLKEWSLYYNCDKCSRANHCKFSTYLNDDSEMQTCWLAYEATKNFIIRTFFVLDLEYINDLKKQKYLDAVFYFHKYVYTSELKNGRMTDNKHLEWMGEQYALYEFSGIITLRDTLNSLCENLKEFPEIYRKTSVLLVEGKSEKAFIENVRGQQNTSLFDNFLVDVYGCKSEKTFEKLRKLIRHYQDIGYSIYIQGDADGNGDNTGYDKFIDYIKNEYLSEEQIFQFEFDFETSIPVVFLYEALVDLRYLKNISLEDFKKSIIKGKSINYTLETVHNINIKGGGCKIRIAELIGKRSMIITDNEKNNEFIKSELNKFKLFLRRVDISN